MYLSIQHIHSALRRPGINIHPTDITIHSTGNTNSTAQNERDFLTSPYNTRKASFHLVVDDQQVIECIPLNEMAYHAGCTDGNSRSIGIEICESGNREKTLKNAAELTAALLISNKWETERLKRHFDWTLKNCPRILNEDKNWTGWRDFLKMVKTEIALQSIKSISINLNGKMKAVAAIEKDGCNYIKLQDLRDDRISIDYDTKHKVPIVQILY